jgi:hypothetical protein
MGLCAECPNLAFGFVCDGGTCPTIGACDSDAGALVIATNAHRIPIPCGVAFQLEVMATCGTPPYVWESLGTFPKGVEFQPENDALIDGVIRDCADTADDIEIEVRDSSGAHAIATVSFH